MKLLDVIESSRIDRIPDKTSRLLSGADYKEQGFTVKHAELRLYQKKNMEQGIYSIVTLFVETDKGTVERILNEGYLGPNALEEEMAYITSHLVISELILRSIKRLEEAIMCPERTTFDARIQLLITIIKTNGYLKDKKVEEAIKKTPRHLFVSDEFVEQAYDDKPLPTRKMQTISQPSVVAKMTELLDVKNDSKILEIGCGSGWQSAILSKLVPEKTIYSVERIPEIVEFAKQNHKKAGIKNVEIILGDGTLGLPEQSPFDRIIVTAGCKKIPPPLLEQLNIGGILVAPVGEYYDQDLVVVQKTAEGIKEIKRSTGVIFAPLIGKFGFLSA
jgi:protein-L-isoaspartate(D-aspartate) O-methyltransferase